MKWLERRREKRRRQDRIEYLRARCHRPGLSEDELLERQLEFIAAKDGISPEEARRRYGPVHMEPLRHDGDDAPTGADGLVGLQIQRILPDLHYDGPPGVLGWVARKVLDAEEEADG